MITVEDAWDHLESNGIATEEELQLITSINGYTVDTLEDVLFHRTGERSFESDEDEDEDEDAAIIWDKQTPTNYSECNCSNPYCQA